MMGCSCICHNPPNKEMPLCPCYGRAVYEKSQIDLYKLHVANLINDIYTEAASYVANEFYPKGKSERRGEFLRDAAVLLSKLQEPLLKLAIRQDVNNE